MTVKNLSQLKRALSSGVPFEVVNHHIHPAYTGHVRVVHVMQTNGMYTYAYKDPGAYINSLNGGKGLWCPFGKASDWSFYESFIRFSIKGRAIMDIRLLEKGGE